MSVLWVPAAFRALGTIVLDGYWRHETHRFLLAPSEETGVYSNRVLVQARSIKWLKLDIERISNSFSFKKNPPPSSLIHRNHCTAA